jgi:hypothetical protein
MSFVPNYPEYMESGVAGPNPTAWFGVDDVDGDASDWITVGPGSEFIKRDLTNDLAGLPLTKIKNDSLDNDWTGWQVIGETVSYTDFTDGGGAAGTYTMKQTIPAGAIVWKTIVQNVTGFAGDTSAALIVGDGTDTDRYMTSTLNVFSDVVAIDGGAISGTAIHTTAKTPVLTVTSGSDWGAVTAGTMTVKIIFFR